MVPDFIDHVVLKGFVHRKRRRSGAPRTSASALCRRRCEAQVLVPQTSEFNDFVREATE